jgi:predicted dehydrogenase
MDYTEQSLRFKVRKVTRYARLYGARRTLAKVEAEYHMRRRFDELPKLRGREAPEQHVGIVGCGKFAYAQIAYYLRGARGRVIRGAMDIDIHRAASLARRYRAGYYTDDAARVIEDPRIDLVYIASNHASHTEYAIACLRGGKRVHIEKPHVVTFDQLHRLCAAMEASDARVNLGFNRPGSRIGVAIERALDQETGGAMLNWFIAGHDIPGDHWYFRPEEGGRVLGNLCHWTDFVLQLVPAERRYPILINPARMGSRDSNIAVTYVFADGTIAAITFSAKGHTFEGVRERFAAHKGDVLISMDDFKTLTVERGAVRRTTRLRHRDHGHRGAIMRSYEMARPAGAEAVPGLPTRYVWETGELFLKTREALESGAVLQVEAFAPDRLGAEAAEAAP